MKYTHESNVITRFINGNNHLFSLLTPVQEYHYDIYELLSRNYQEIHNSISTFQIQKIDIDIDTSLNKQIHKLCEGLPSVLHAYRTVYNNTTNRMTTSIHQLCDELREIGSLSQDRLFPFQPVVKEIDNIKRQIDEHGDFRHLSVIKKLWNTHSFLYDTGFIPLDVQLSFEKGFIHKIQYSIRDVNVKGHLYTIIFNIFTNEQSVDPEFIKDLFCRILSVCSLYESSCKHLTFEVYLSNSTKNVIVSSSSSSSQVCWSSININTGCTFVSSCKPITIWRKQELIKTCYHEMIHSFHWDIQENVTSVNNQLREIFNITNNSESIKLYEAYTETWATLLNVYLNCFLNIERRNDTHFIFEMIDTERKFLMFQVAKILYCSGFTDFNQFKTNNTMSLNYISFCQETDVFSYFFIKSMLLWDFQWFVTTIHKIPFQELKKNDNVTVQALFAQIRKVINDTDYVSCINGILHNYFILLSEHEKQLFINKTIRMTASEYL